MTQGHVMSEICIQDVLEQARNFSVYEQIEIGLQYALKERATAEDLACARAWFWVAACYYESFLAQYYWALTWGEFNAHDFPEEIDLDTLKQIAAEGQLAAVYVLGVFYENEDMQLAVEYYAYAAERGFYPAMNNLADKYEQGLGVIQDIPQAIQLYTQAAEQEIAAAEWSLGLLYFNGTWIEQDLSLARYWFTKADQHGWAGADEMLSRLMIPVLYS